MPEEERSFIEDIGGYELPADIPEVVEGQEIQYYRHPIGTYYGVVGKLKFKYVDANDKKCEPTDVGARLRRSIMPIWITEFLGTPEQPQQKMVIPKEMIIPAEFTTPEIYYPVLIDMGKDIWKSFKYFDPWRVNGHIVVAPHPQKKSIKTLNVKQLAYYYGVHCKFKLSPWQNKDGKESIILDGAIELINQPRVPAALLNTLEKAYEEKQEQEFKQRREEADNIQQSVPDTDFDEGLADDIDNIFTAEENGDLPS